MTALEVVQEIIERHRLHDEVFTLISHGTGPSWDQRRRTLSARLDHLAEGLSSDPRAARPPGTTIDGRGLLRGRMSDLDDCRSASDHVVSLSSRLTGPGGQRHLAMMDLRPDGFIPYDQLTAALHALSDGPTWLLGTDRHHHVYGDFLLDELAWLRWNARFLMSLVLADSRYVGQSLICGCNLLRLNTGGTKTRVPHDRA